MKKLCKLVQADGTAVDKTDQADYLRFTLPDGSVLDVVLAVDGLDEEVVIRGQSGPGGRFGCRLAAMPASANVLSVKVLP